MTGRNPYERVKFSGADVAGQGVYARAERGQADTSSDAQRHCERGPASERSASLATKANLTTSAKATVVRRSFSEGGKVRLYDRSARLRHTLDGLRQGLARADYALKDRALIGDQRLLGALLAPWTAC